MSASQSQSQTTVTANFSKTKSGLLADIIADQSTDEQLRELAKRELAKRELAKRQAKSASTKKAPMGPSGYRIKFGSSDQLVMDAVRAQWPTITFDDDDIVGNVGWAITPKTAIQKMRTLIES